MREEGVLAVAVESPAGRADLVVDAVRPLRGLSAALAAATGMPGHLAAGDWQVWEGQRQLDPDCSLADQGVVAGSGLWLTPGIPPAESG